MACSVVFRVGGSVRWCEVTVGVFGARVTSGVVVFVCLSSLGEGLFCIVLCDRFFS